MKSKEVIAASIGLSLGLVACGQEAGSSEPAVTETVTVESTVEVTVETQGYLDDTRIAQESLKCTDITDRGFAVHEVVDSTELNMVAESAGTTIDAMTRFNRDVFGVSDISALAVGSCVAIPSAKIEPITDEQFTGMQGVSWREGCLESRDELRGVVFPHVDFDGNTQMGEIIVNTDIADDTKEIFEELYEIRFPIKQAKALEEITPAELKTDDLTEAQAIDGHAMSESNTLGFTCRYVVSDPPREDVSLHGLGRAIDINQVQNPYAYGLNLITVVPEAGNAFMDRDNVRPGMIVEGDVLGDKVLALFKDKEFTWGGDNKNSKDYHHFQKTK